MRVRPFGKTGERVAVIGQGTWKVRHPAQASEAISVGLDLGMTHVDTAELYERQSGSESMLGPVVHDRRDEVFLASKVLPDHATARGVVSACKDSMVRLMTDWIDLYYLHWRGQVPLEETLRAMAELRDAGWIRYIGVSNFGVPDLEEAESILGRGVLAANQVVYHLGDRGIESEVLPWCRRHGVAVVGYSPFGSGAMPLGPGARVLEDVARGVGLTTHQVVLAFLSRHPEVFLIPKAESVRHVQENAAGDVALPAEALAVLEEAFPVVGGLRAI